MATIKDIASYLLRLFGDAIFRAAAIAGVIALLARIFIPSPRRPPILDAFWLSLIILAMGFMSAAYRIDRDLRAKLSTERSALRKDFKKKLITLKFTIERRNRGELIPMDQVLMIKDLAKDLGDSYMIAECDEIGRVLQRNYGSLGQIAYLFEQSRRDYDSVIGRIGYVLNHLEKII